MRCRSVVMGGIFTIPSQNGVGSLGEGWKGAGGGPEHKSRRTRFLCDERTGVEFPLWNP